VLISKLLTVTVEVPICTPQPVAGAIIERASTNSPCRVRDLFIT